ncbi:MAG: sigma factor [Gaiellaceae bacterium]|jgi:RNA polymerase sigma factor (sigma-70 family)
MVQEPHDALRVEALEEIYRGHYGRFLRVALAIVGERETAQEVVQEAFAKAIRSRFDFRREGSPEAWMWAIVVNLARNTRASRDATTTRDRLDGGLGH